VSYTQSINVDMGYRIEDMICDLGQDGFQQAHVPMYDKIENDSKMPLYPGCTDFTRLSAVLALVNLSAESMNHSVPQSIREKMFYEAHWIQPLLL